MTTNIYISVQVNADTFAIRLRLAMAGREMTADQVSRRSGIHASTISRYLNGDVNPSFETACILSRVLDVPVSFFDSKSHR